MTSIGNASSEQRRALILVQFVSLFVHSVYMARNVNTARIRLHLYWTSWPVLIFHEHNTESLDILLFNPVGTAHIQTNVTVSLLSNGKLLDKGFPVLSAL